MSRTRTARSSREACRSDETDRSRSLPWPRPPAHSGLYRVRHGALSASAGADHSQLGLWLYVFDAYWRQEKNQAIDRCGGKRPARLLVPELDRALRAERLQTRAPGADAEDPQRDGVPEDAAAFGTAVDQRGHADRRHEHLRR